MADLDRSELQDWVERVVRRAPRRVPLRQRRRVGDEPNVERWCVDAPGMVLAVLEDDVELRSAVTTLTARTEAAREAHASLRAELRERVTPFPEEAATLEDVLNDPTCDTAVIDSVADFLRDLDTLNRRRSHVDALATQLEERSAIELRDALVQAESNPRLVGRVVFGVELAGAARDLRRQLGASETELEEAPGRLAGLLADQSEAIQQQEVLLASLDEQLEASRNKRLSIAALLEHEEHQRSLLETDLDRLDAEFDVLLARARRDSTVDVQELYETYRERTDRERVWREREQAEALAEELQIALRSLQLQLRDLRHELEECADERSQLSMELDDLQSVVDHLTSANRELSDGTAELVDDLAAARSEASWHSARGVPLSDAGFTPVVMQALHDAGYYTLGDLADAFPHGVEGLPSIGQARLGRIEEVLITRGLR